MKVGDVHESPSGLSFTVVAFDKKTVTADVERVVRKGGQHAPQTVEVRRRVFATGKHFDNVASAYTHLNGRKKPDAKTNTPPVRPPVTPHQKS